MNQSGEPLGFERDMCSGVGMHGAPWPTSPGPVYQASTEWGWARLVSRVYSPPTPNLCSLGVVADNAIVDIHCDSNDGRPDGRDPTGRCLYCVCVYHVGRATDSNRESTHVNE